MPHKSMGKVLVPSAMRAGLRLASSCKVIFPPSEPAWPRSTFYGSKAAAADAGRGLMASTTPASTVTMNSVDPGRTLSHTPGQKSSSVHRIACCRVFFSCK